MPKSDADPVRKTNVRIIDCAPGGQTAQILAQPTSAYWDTVFTRLRGRGSSPRQVQVVWLKDANANPTGGFAVTRDTLTAQFFRIAQIIKQKLPNAKLCYFTSRIYAGYASSTLNPEPYAYENAFSVKQVSRNSSPGPSVELRSAHGPVVAPWLSWGPYLWADGLTPRSDGLTWACSRAESSRRHAPIRHRPREGRRQLARVRAPRRHHRALVHDPRERWEWAARLRHAWLAVSPIPAAAASCSRCMQRPVPPGGSRWWTRSVG